MTEKARKTFLLCGRCGNASVHTLLCSEDSAFRYCDADGFFHHEPATYHIFSCNGCTGISVYIWSCFHSPHSEFGQRTYPPSVAEESEIPYIVRDAYREAERVKQHSNVAYAILARRVLEVIAKERGVAERNLSRAMAVLANRGEIPPILAEAATLIRIFGNVSAHSSVEKINGIHVEMIEKFLEVLVQYLYVAPAALEGFKFLLGIEADGS
jgi:Domain of unknown function (DUF4145)